MSHPVRVLVIGSVLATVAFACLLGFLIFTEDIARANVLELGLLTASLALSVAGLAIFVLNWTEITEWANDEDDDHDEGG